MDNKTEVTPGRAWLAELPSELAAQRRVMVGLMEFCEATPLVTSLSVGCSLGRGAADALSDIDAALGIAAERGSTSAGPVRAVEEAVVAYLPRFGALIDVLQHRAGRCDRFIRRVFAQFTDGTQLDLAVMAEAEVRRGDAAPDFVSLYQAAGQPGAEMPTGNSRADDELTSAYAVTGAQIRERAFLGWCALFDAGKYLRRGSLFRAARASATVLTSTSNAAAKKHPTRLPSAMAHYVTETLFSLEDSSA